MENGIVNQHWSQCLPLLSLLLIYIYMRMLYMLHILYDIYVTPSLPFSLCSLLPSSLLTKMLSLNHASAFLDRRRYYETYVRYVVFF